MYLFDSAFNYVDETAIAANKACATAFSFENGAYCGYIFYSRYRYCYRLLFRGWLIRHLLLDLAQRWFKKILFPYKFRYL